MKKLPWMVLAAALVASSAAAGYRVEAVEVLALGDLGGRGQLADPSLSPDGSVLGFEFLGAAGDTLEVYLAELARGAGADWQARNVRQVLPVRSADPFALGTPGERPVSEFLTWGPPKRGRPRLAVAATRQATARGARQINFDLYLVEPGRKRFLTDHGATDSQPSFSPDGDFLAFVSGRSGQGDLYLYHFFAAADPAIRLTFEEAGSEIYPAWGPGGKRLLFTAHLGAQDHLQVLDDVPRLAAIADDGRRRAAARSATRTLTPGWKAQCLAGSFSPDGTQVAFYARAGSAGRADLYVAGVDGQVPRRLLEGGLPETRRGPRWAPDGSGLFAVREDAAGLNPLLWVPLAAEAQPVVLQTGTQLNSDPFPVELGGQPYLVFVAQGSDAAADKRWRKLYLAELRAEKP